MDQLIAEERQRMEVRYEAAYQFLLAHGEFVNHQTEQRAITYALEGVKKV